MSLAAARTARHRDERFPQPVARHGLAHLYDPVELGRLARSEGEPDMTVALVITAAVRPGGRRLRGEPGDPPVGAVPVLQGRPGPRRHLGPRVRRLLQLRRQRTPAPGSACAPSSVSVRAGWRAARRGEADV